MKKNSLIIALVFLIIGFAFAYFIFFSSTIKSQGDFSVADRNSTSDSTGRSIINPFIAKNGAVQDDDKFNYLENEITVIKKKLEKIELTLQKLTNSSNALSHRPVVAGNNRFSSALTQRLFNLDTLIRGGIDPAVAEDIVRRKNSIELKRLALQDRAIRDGYLNTERYFDELEQINTQDVNLRQELGDDRYDQYLYNSKQNNRIKISSVMLGSAAEQAGIQTGDVVVSYDNMRMFTWSELKDATAEGQLGEYVSISVNRNGEIFSFSVPRGPLGTQLGATRLTP